MRPLRVALRSREVFRNWLSVGFAYLLFRLGLLGNRRVEVILRDGSSCFIDLDAYGRVINAYFDGLVRSVSCQDGGLVLDFLGVRFRDVFRSMIEVFVDDEWGFLNVRGRHVVDIGAFVGDSAIYFALRGAERVVAVEPHPKAFAQMLDNIKLNGLDKVIVPVNTAVGSDGYLELPLDVSLDLVIDKIYWRRFSSRSFVRVRSVSLSELLGVVNVRTDVLKLDCEGCEVGVIVGDYDVVKRFGELGIEVHPGVTGMSIKDFIDTLRDFKCRVVNSWPDRAIIHCVRS